MTSSNNHHPKIEFHKDTYVCYGDWTILEGRDLTDVLQHLDSTKEQSIFLNGENITKLDSAGALILLEAIDKLYKKNIKVELKNFSNKHSSLIDLIDANRTKTLFKPKSKIHKGILFNIGKQTVNKFKQIEGLITLIGDLSEKLFLSFKEAKFQIPSISANIYNTGITALPIVGLLSFLIGIVLAYQMGLQLEEYGANNFIAYLAGMAIFREFAPLITAIIVAGRTSSSFTAQIGLMKINEEIDALHTMGLSATELLVVPKVLGLLIIFPLLIFWAVFFGILGSMLMSNLMLNVGYSEFLTRLQDSVGFKQLMLGLYKAPAFALLIALVGCFQGFKVQYNANSLGLQTTKSVVQALFLIIIADAIYSVIYSWMNL